MSMKSAGVDAGSTDDEVHMDPRSAGGRLNCAVLKAHVVLPQFLVPMQWLYFRAIVVCESSPTL
jgi:hypothetical protein